MSFDSILTEQDANTYKFGLPWAAFFHNNCTGLPVADVWTILINIPFIDGTASVQFAFEFVSGKGYYRNYKYDSSVWNAWIEL